MTREDAIKNWIMPACEHIWSEKKCKEIQKALELSNPCDLCRYAPASSGDGKPCTMCPAERKEE